MVPVSNINQNKIKANANLITKQALQAPNNLNNVTKIKFKTQVIHSNQNNQNSKQPLLLIQAITKQHNLPNES